MSIFGNVPEETHITFSGSKDNCFNYCFGMPPYTVEMEGSCCFQVHLSVSMKLLLNILL